MASGGFVGAVPGGGPAAEASASATAPSPTGRPVLLVHGILGQRHLYWNLFRRRLEEAGFGVREVNLPFVLLGDIRRAAGVLAQAVDAARAATGSEHVDIVAHSAGGLVARYYVQALGGDARVRHLVLLGTPHRGTLASFLLPVVRVAVQASPGSRFLGELDSKPMPDSVQVTNFWSPLDGIVIPAENSVLRAPGVRNVELRRMHHWGFLVSRAVCDQVKAVLQGTPAPTRSTPRRLAQGRGAPRPRGR